ncbi:hypothetical protein AB1N83_008045, partial [Pleurotus pulmonarius]
MAPILPLEILGLILAHIDDKKDLCNLLITSQQFFHLVEPVLYARIELTSSQLTRIKGLLEALEGANSERARFVRIFCFKANAHDTEVTGTINKILAKTLALRALKLRAIHGSSFEGPFFQQSPVFALTDLRISSFRLQEDDQCLLRFLESQTCLQTLYLHSKLCRSEGDTKDIFSSAAFPNLKALSVHSSLVHAFFRTSARLTHLRVSGRVPGRVATRVSGHFVRARWLDPYSADELCTDTLETLSCSDIFDA